MNRWTRWTGAMGLAALFAAAPAIAQTKWVMATPYAENFHTANIRQFIAEVEKATEGKLAIQLHNNASLLPMGQIKRGVQTGQVQLGEILLSAYSQRGSLLRGGRRPFPRLDLAAGRGAEHGDRALCPRPTASARG